MARVIRLQGDSNAHDRPWRVALEQGVQGCRASEFSAMLERGFLKDAPACGDVVRGK